MLELLFVGIRFVDHKKSAKRTDGRTKGYQNHKHAGFSKSAVLCDLRPWPKNTVTLQEDVNGADHFIFYSIR
jgi:hypothetical protein